MTSTISILFINQNYVDVLSSATLLLGSLLTDALQTIKIASSQCSNMAGCVLYSKFKKLLVSIVMPLISEPYFYTLTGIKTQRNFKLEIKLPVQCNKLLVVLKIIQSV